MKRLATTIKALLIVLVLGAPSSAYPAEVLKIDADTAASRAIEVSALSRSAASRVAEAEESVAAVMALRRPDMSVHASLSRKSSVPEYQMPILDPDGRPTVLYPNIENTGRASVQAQQLIYAGGTVQAQQAAARFQLDGLSADQQVVHADLALAARLSFWQVVAEQAALDAAHAQVRRAERLLEDTNALREAGMAVDADVYAAESRSALARVQVIRRGAAAENAMAQLRSLLQIEAGQQIQLAHTNAPQVPAQEDTAALVNTALQSRAELRALDRYGVALEQQAVSIDGSRRPMVSATAQWNLARPNERIFPIEDAWNDSWSVALIASWKVFDGGKSRSQAAAVRHNRQALNSQRDEQARRVTLEVQTAQRDVHAARAAVDASEVALRAASSRERTSNERYDAGLAPLSEVLDAQAELAEAERFLVRARAETAIAWAKLQRAVGQ